MTVVISFENNWFSCYYVTSSLSRGYIIKNADIGALLAICRTFLAFLSVFKQSIDCYHKQKVASYVFRLIIVRESFTVSCEIRKRRKVINLLWQTSFERETLMTVNCFFIASHNL